ncbi:MAG: hypothetical protein KBC43_05150 [Bacteroidales bacterium]|nr:hypothetical protein [Bacteroidales bacterium]
MRWSLIEIEMESRFQPPENRMCPHEGFVNGKAQFTISYKELLIQFKKVEKFPEDKKKLVKELLDAFLFKDNVQKQLVL